ncbi:hypothetical protein FQA39_LY14871 [Lamprigera yunnana]|nr:hypothetical protein FQA39_LY14871 [Lamprigera yunnana]
MDALSRSREQIKLETGVLLSKQFLELQRRLDVAIPLLEEYDKLNLQIVDDTNEVEGNSDDQTEFENSYFSIVSRC